MGKKPGQKSVEGSKKKTVAKVGTKVEKVKKPIQVAKEKSEMSENACKVTGCRREYRAKGYCKEHYRRWRQGGFGIARYKRCHSGECRKPMVLNRHGLCEEHYQKFYVKGEVVTSAAPAVPAKQADKAAQAS